jgi:hypothetical protein
MFCHKLSIQMVSALHELDSVFPALMGIGNFYNTHCIGKEGHHFSQDTLHNHNNDSALIPKVH